MLGGGFVDKASMETIVIGGAGNPEFGAMLAERMGVVFEQAYLTYFKDSEFKMRISSKVAEKEVVLVQGLFPDIHQNMLELYFLTDWLGMKAKRLQVVLPYPAFSRQDRPFDPDQFELPTFDLIGKHFKGSGVACVTVVEVHNLRSIETFGVPLVSLSAIPTLADYMNKHMDLVNPVIVSPDFGGRERAKQFAKLMRADTYFFDKHRAGDGKITMRGDFVNLTDRDAVIVDDVASTANTAAMAADKLVIFNARRVILAVTHAQLLGKAEENLRKAGVKEIVATNTIPTRHSCVDVSGLVAESISNGKKLVLA